MRSCIKLGFAGSSPWRLHVFLRVHDRTMRQPQPPRLGPPIRNYWLGKIWGNHGKDARDFQPGPALALASVAPFSVQPEVGPGRSNHCQHDNPTLPLAFLSLLRDQVPRLFTCFPISIAGHDSPLRRLVQQTHRTHVKSYSCLPLKLSSETEIRSPPLPHNHAKQYEQHTS